MKKLKVLIIVLLAFLIVGCKSEKESYDYLFEETLSQINIPDVIYNNIELIENYTCKDGKVVEVNYLMDNDAIDFTGEINPSEEDVDVNITICMNWKDNTKEYNVKTKVASMKNIIAKSIEKNAIPSKVNSDLDFPSKDGIVRIKWNSSNIDVITKEGKCNYVDSDTNVTIKATFSIKTSNDSYQEDKEYNVVVGPWDSETRFEKVLKNISIPNETIYDLTLPYELGYGVFCNWSSNDENVISNFGRVNRQVEDKLVTLNLTMYSNNATETKNLTYEVIVKKAIAKEGEMNFYKHNLINRANDMDTNSMTNLVLDNGKVKLKDNCLEGTYESVVYNTLDFYRIVGSFSCITSLNSTCELAISIKANDAWSKYFSYGEYGLGRNNLYYNQTDTYSYMDTDMIESKSGYNGNGVKYKITLRRDKATTASPELSLVALAIFMKDYNYAVDTSNLPDQVDWDVPKLYQHDVPSIGGVICSATTTTMLLKFAGYDFSDKGYDYEHHYIADMVADKGHNNPTYGNWSYNMMTAGAFGIDAYVGKMYSWDEIRYYLANNGPIGVSIGGNFGAYTTNGHLLVIRGYKIVDGNTTVICNDPNVRGVYYEVSLEIFLRCFGSVVYLMEFQNVQNRIKDIY